MTCFRVPAQRHFEDATFLLGDNRLANADHLFGISAECALKCILAGLGIIADSAARPKSPYGCHINVLWDIYNNALSGRSCSKYCMAKPKEPFSGWNIDHRYKDAPPADADVARHKAAAHAAMRMMQMAKMDGYVQ